MRLPFDAQLLLALRAAPAHLSAEELAAAIGHSREAVEAHLTGLRAAGFDIELKPGFGYRLLGNPDRLIADDLWARLESVGGISFLREIIVFEETGSTNDVAVQFGRQETLSNVAIFAERQTAGRGRFGRKWESASHRGLWFSLLLRPELPVAHWPRLTAWAAVAIAAALEKAAPCEAAIKWPNDVFLDGKKAAGILIEMVADAGQQPFAVVGIGVNVAHEVDDFPEELRGTATSLRLAAGRPVERAAVAAAILVELDRYYPLLRSDFDAVLSQARSRSFILGKRIRVHSGKNVLEGVAEDLDVDGHLLLRMEDGALEKLSAGEVSLRAV